MKNRQIKKKGLAQKEEYFILFLITLIGGILRFSNLSNPLFSDSAFFGVLVRDGVWTQEQFPHAILWAINHNWLIQSIYSQFHINIDTQLRLPFLFCGIASIPLIYFIVKENKLFASIFVAFNPLFIFWSGLARPYSMAGFFVILAWRFKWFYIPAMLTTPISIVGYNFKHKKVKLMFGIIVISAVVLYLIRPDIHYDGWNRNLWSIFQTASRWWYLPMISFALYMSDYGISFMKEMQYEKKIVYPLLIVVSVLFLHWDEAIYKNVTFSNELQSFFPTMDKYWYRQDCKFSDYRGCGKLDFATEWSLGSWYGGKQTRYFSHYEMKRVDSLLNAGDTLKIGMGKLGISSCTDMINKYFGKDFLKRYEGCFYIGGIIKVRLFEKDHKYYSDANTVLQ